LDEFSSGAFVLYTEDKIQLDHDEQGSFPIALFHRMNNRDD
jgi:hypothetical protein